jgi:hypothetical protein
MKMPAASASTPVITPEMAKSGDCREADHDQINGEQEHSDVFGEDEVH